MLSDTWKIMVLIMSFYAVVAIAIGVGIGWVIFG